MVNQILVYLPSFDWVVVVIYVGEFNSHDYSGQKGYCFEVPTPKWMSLDIQIILRFNLVEFIVILKLVEVDIDP
jgi:hypothetical protein